MLNSSRSIGVSSTVGNLILVGVVVAVGSVFAGTFLTLSIQDDSPEADVSFEQNVECSIGGECVTEVRVEHMSNADFIGIVYPQEASAGHVNYLGATPDDNDSIPSTIDEAGLDGESVDGLILVGVGDEVEITGEPGEEIFTYFGNESEIILGDTYEIRTA